MMGLNFTYDPGGPIRNAPVSYLPPTEEEWAFAQAIVIRQQANPNRIGIQKRVVKNGVPYVQTVWLTIGQFRDIAISEM